MRCAVAVRFAGLQQARTSPALHNSRCAYAAGLLGALHTSASAGQGNYRAVLYIL